MTSELIVFITLACEIRPLRIEIQRKLLTRPIEYPLLLEKDVSHPDDFAGAGVHVLSPKFLAAGPGGFLEPICHDRGRPAGPPEGGLLCTLAGGQNLRIGFNRHALWLWFWHFNLLYFRFEHRSHGYRRPFFAFAWPRMTLGGVRLIKSRLMA